MNNHENDQPFESVSSNVANKAEDSAMPLSISAQARMSAMPPYLEGLNNEQREAILCIDGPLLVLAGAGTCLLYTSPSPRDA